VIGGRINQLKVLSDNVDDVTTIENIVKSFAKPGMSDQDRAKGLWTSVIKYRHKTALPNEHLAGDQEAHDPVKIFYVYGYCRCCCTSALVEALNREDGREARGRILNGHSLPEVRYGGGWHMFDGSLITFFSRPPRTQLQPAINPRWCRSPPIWQQAASAPFFSSKDSGSLFWRLSGMSNDCIHEAPRRQCDRLVSCLAGEVPVMR
jgi:hypothetical protein